MDCLTLLETARQAGLDVTVTGERLVVQGPRHAVGLAQALLERKDEVLALLSLRPLAAPASPARQCPVTPAPGEPSNSPLARFSARDLNRWLDSPDALRQEAARRELLARADLILDEVEGQPPPPNPTVIKMFEEARARFGARARGDVGS
jgi:hypothetical protein